MANIILYLITVPLILVIDLIWLGLIAKDFYRSQLGDLFAPSINWYAAIAFYLIYASAVVFFAVLPALAKGSLLYAALVGAFLGFVAYATYDLTNLAVTRDWPLLMSLADMVWGALMTGAVSAAVFVIATTLLGR